MYRLPFVLSMLAIVVFGIGLYGCSSSQNPDASGSPQPLMAQTGAHDHHGDHAAHGEHANHNNGDQGHQGEIEQNLAKLSDADRASAQQQHHCPVSGQMLGAMGVPIQVQVKNQEVWMCCPACKDSLLGNPDEYLAALKH